MRKSKAFTLVEAVTIITILSIVAALSSFAVNISGLSDSRVWMAAVKIQSDIRYAQKIAMMLQRRTWVYFVTNQLDYGAGLNHYSVWIESVMTDTPPFSMGVLTNPTTNADFLEEFDGHLEGVEITQTGFDSSGALGGLGNFWWILIFEPDGKAYSYTWFPAQGVYALEEDSFVRLNDIVEVKVNPRTGFATVEEYTP